MKKILTDKDLKRMQKSASSSMSKRKSKETSQQIFDRINENTSNNQLLLDQCQVYWDSLRDSRKRAFRAWKYRRGDQWGDIINDPDKLGKTIVEEDYISRQGKPAFKQNIIAQLIRSIIGQYASNPTKSSVTAQLRENQIVSEMLTNALQSCLDLNDSARIETDALQQYIMSGMHISKTTWSWWYEHNKMDGKIKNISPYSVGFNSDVSDPRLLDLWLIFELHDLRIEDVKRQFAKTKEQADALDMIYNPQTRYTQTMPDTGLTADKYENMDFYMPSDPTMCRVIEVWEKKQEWRTKVWDKLDASFEVWEGDPIENKKEVEALNRERIRQAIENGINEEDVQLIECYEEICEFWYVKFLTPYGQCLFESETPFDHKSHPYTIELSMLNGEVWGLVEEIIDQQRMINRSMILFDFIISASAKGVLLIPEESIPSDCNIDDIAEEWTKFNGVIKYKAKAGVEPPKQVSANSTNIGLNEFISMQMNLINQIAGVSPAMQGQEAKSGTPSALYAQESANASNNIKVLLQNFTKSVRERDTKLLKVLLQYYETGRYIDTNGTSLSEEAKIFNKEMIKDVDFKIKVSSSPDTPAYRMLIEDRLHDLFINQVIDASLYLENSSLPFSDALLQQLKNREKQMQQNLPPQPIDPALLQQIGSEGQQMQQNLPPQSQNVINKLMQQQ